MRVNVGEQAILWHGDCRKVLPIADVDHFIFDPPYERHMHKAKRAGTRRLRTDGGGNLSAVTFASIDGMRDWVATHCMGAGWFIAFCTPEGVAPWRDSCEAAGHRYKRACVWVKPDAAPQFNGQGPAMGAEMFVTTWTGKGMSRWNGGGRRSVFTHQTNPTGRDRLHETEKPLALMRELIELFTNPGDLICDPFMGTGATGVAAVRLGRRFVGIEKDRKYFDRARERIEEAARQPDMFLREAKRPAPPTLFDKQKAATP